MESHPVVVFLMVVAIILPFAAAVTMMPLLRAGSRWNARLTAWQQRHEVGWWLTHGVYDLAIGLVFLVFVADPFMRYACGSGFVVLGCLFLVKASLAQNRRTPTLPD